MNAEAHLAAGWILAHLAPARADRSFRRWVCAAAVVCDIDVLSYIGGGYWYSRLHHALGHNIFFCAAFAALATFFARSRRWELLCFVLLALASHLVTDYYLTRFPLEFLWPFTSKGWIHSYRIGLDHPINTFLSYLSFVVFIVIGIVAKRTPVELFSPELDARIVNLFRKRTMICHICPRGASEICSACHLATCIRHGKITRRFKVICSTCSAAKELTP